MCLAFSPDNQLLAAQGGAPEWNLVIWNWEKAKVAGMLRTCNATGAPVHQACKRLLGLHHIMCTGTWLACLPWEGMRLRLMPGRASTHRHTHSS